MKNLLTIAFILISFLTFSQTDSNNEIVITSEYLSDNPEIRDMMLFEGIAYYKLSFKEKELADKSFHLTVKEIWDGKIKSDSTIIDSKTLGYERVRTINDTVLNLTVISKLTYENKLKMAFQFPNFSIKREFDAIKSDFYSLREVTKASRNEIKYGKKFYLLAYILPYEGDGWKSWCDVDSSGKDIENWGKEFGIKHYLVFEMLFE